MTNIQSQTINQPIEVDFSSAETETTIPPSTSQDNPVTDAVYRDAISQNNLQNLPMNVPNGSASNGTVILPRPYWNGMQRKTTVIPDGRNIVLVPASQNGIQLANVTPAASRQSYLQLASGTPSETSTSLLTTGNDTQFGSIPSGTQVILLAQGSSVPPPGTAPNYAPINSLSPSVSAAPPGPGFNDPYATPGQNGVLSSNTYQSPTATGNTTGFDFGQGYDQMMSFLNQVSGEYYWMPKSGNDPLGVNDVKAQARFAIPCRHLGDTMIYVAPGFRATFLNDDVEKKNLFGGWLDAGIQPVVNQQFRFDLWGSVGVYSDFHKVTSDSIYVRGRGSAYLQLNPNTEAVLGVLYLNREHVKLLPVFGVIWTPNPSVEWRLVFPDPKLAKHFGDTGSTQWWGYVRGDYGGGSWAVNTDTLGVVKFDYNDIRVALGLEFRNPAKQSVSGYVEVGGAFDRELYYGKQSYNKSSCVYLGGGLTY
ncbi:MAG: hypothetical protein FWC50_07790 [Planctomycetaceae bacterium]|nr:hypothetical protein [Planctomycetaceae bacterium]